MHTTLKSHTEIISQIKKKKELAHTADSVIADQLTKYLTKNKIDLAHLSQKQKKVIVGEIRAQLRLLVGRFQKTNANKKKILKTEGLSALLKTHTSTSERMNFYPQFKKIIADLKPQSILDLGCGLNPLAIATKSVKYYASDINEGDLLIVSEFFKQNNIEGKICVQDLRNLQEDLPKTDLCLMLKVLDVVDPDHKLSEGIIKRIKSKKLIVSFSTKKLSGRKMNFPRRFWFEKMLARLNLKYTAHETDNEFFYFIDLAASK